MFAMFGKNDKKLSEAARQILKTNSVIYNMPVFSRQIPLK